MRGNKRESGREIHRYDLKQRKNKKAAILLNTFKQIVPIATVMISSYIFVSMLKKLKPPEVFTCRRANPANVLTISFMCYSNRDMRFV